MINKKNMDIVDILLIAALALFLFELIFIDMGLLIFIVICTLGIYFGKKSYYRTRGKVMFWLGVFFLVISVMNSIAFKLLLLAVVIYLIYKWYKSRQDPDYYKPQFSEKESDLEQTEEEGFLFTNNWFGHQQTEKRAYEWQDINIQAGVGDMVVDLNYTVIPKSEPVIVIRNVIGNVQIIVPYDVEVSVHHSVIFGSIEVLDHVESNTWNRVLHLQTSNYNDAKQKVKIFTSMVAGKIEVKRG